MLLSKNTTLFVVANAAILCVLMSGAAAVSQRDENKLTRLDFLSVEEDISTTAEDYQYDGPLLADACDCGPNSRGCTMENGTKVCHCNYRYRQEGDICKGWCEDKWDCDNGGLCVNESCQCLPGTSGDLCKTVDECEGIKGPIMCGDPNTALCRYDAKNLKPYCMCRIYDYIYYPKERTCIECDCGKFGSCSLIDGKKTCKCNEDAALRQVSFFGDIVDRCDVCRCGNNSDGCSFEGLYEKICNCKKGTAQQPDLYGDACNECNCGPNGQCYFKGWYRYCKCDQGYKPFLTINKTDLYCKECDCGKNGVCSFENEVKQCKCNPGYALREGICTACQCYADDKTVDCTFTDKIQTCLCPKGYETSKFFCKDIDECMNSSNSCPSTTNCINTMGSYECSCKEGYAPKSAGSDPKIDGCEDINECEDANLCPRKNTICTNFPGTYSCVCTNGYVPVSPNSSPKVAGCEKGNTPNKGSSGWTIALIALSVLICVSLAAIIAVILRRRSTRRSPLAIDTQYQMRSS